jgi:hypothetical protein
MEGVTIKLITLATIPLFALPLIHPFGPVRDQRSNALPVDNPAVRALIEKSCQNCHSQRTEWPLYSRLPLISWAIEKDVADAREHLDFSRWDQYSNADKRDLLTRMGSEVRSGEMPLSRYVLLHPDARLSSADVQLIYEWTKEQRHALGTRRE